MLAEAITWRFDDFLLDMRTRALFRLNGEHAPALVPLGSRAFDVLSVLMDHRGALVSRQEIMDAVWPNIAVEDNNLTVQIAALRHVLDAGRANGSCIQTTPGRGYRFLPDVTPSDQWPPGRTSDDAEVIDTTTVGGANAETTESARPEMANTPAAPPPSIESDKEDRLSATAGIAGVPAQWRRYRGKIAASAVCLILLIASLAWFAAGTSWLRSAPVVASAPPTLPDTSTIMPATSIPKDIAAPVDHWRVPIAVLPFTRSGDGVNEQTADGVADSLAIDLSQFPGIRVIARQATLIRKDRPIDIKRIGQDLGVRYAVDGSVRASEGILHVSAQLLSTKTGEEVWAERFDIGRQGDSRSMEDVARQIAFMAAFRAFDAESARTLQERPDNPTASDVLARATSAYNLPPGPDRDAKILALYERAVALDPASPEALAGLAEALLARLPIWNIFNEDPRAPSTFRKMDALITRAETLSPISRRVMLARQQLTGRQAGCPAVIPVAQRTMEMHPTLASPHMWQGICLLFDGKPAEAIPKFNDAIRVHPRNPSVDSFHRLIGYALLFQNRYDEAVAAFQAALGSNPNVAATFHGNDYAAIAAAQALAGDLASARQSAAEAVRLWPTITVRAYYPFKVTSSAAAAQVARMRDGLRLAGIRDHADEDADPGLPATDALSDVYDAPTPIGVPGARTIRTPDLVALLEQRKPLVLDMNPWGATIPGAIGLWGTGIGGSLSDEYQEPLGRKMAHLTGGNHAAPIVTVGWNAERHQGRNLALRLAALGYTEIYWYRGGREAWMAANLPVAEVTLQDW